MTKQLEKATLGGGCFWCIEAVYQELKGVVAVESGYAGGHVKNPTYREVCSAMTGHAEVTQITYDPAVISYEDILYVFWRVHDPTTLNRQGADVGPQYRSIILTHSEAQREIAERSRQEAEAARIWPDPIVTEIKPLTQYYVAEPHHQNYYRNNRFQGYCVVVIDPKLRKFRKSFADRLQEPAVS